jgi:hypothetical protein
MNNLSPSDSSRAYEQMLRDAVIAAETQAAQASLESPVETLDESNGIESLKKDWNYLVTMRNAAEEKYKRFIDKAHKTRSNQSDLESFANKKKQLIADVHAAEIKAEKAYQKYKEAKNK